MKVAEKLSELVNSGFCAKINEHSISITYQEWCLYWFLRARNSGEELTEEFLQSHMKSIINDHWINSAWEKEPASKYNEKKIVKKWTDVL